MTKKLVPMIHVTDVRATVGWYESIGFTVLAAYEEDGDLNWAKLSFGDSELMFSSGGRASTAERREVDLFLDVDDVDLVFRELGQRVDVVEEPHDTFYGMRELIIRDVNRFWITFGQPARRNA